MRNSCASHLSVDKNWHSASEAAELRCEESFFTEWKQGNTPKEKLRDPAFGGGFFWMLILDVSLKVFGGLESPFTGL